MTIKIGISSAMITPPAEKIAHGNGSFDGRI